MARSDTRADDTSAIAGESFLQRLSRRKHEARQANQALSTTDAEPDDPAHAPDVATPPPLTDADMPPLESLTDDSDFTGFLSSEVSDALRRKALRKLFLSERFNVIDELDDYNEDFTTFEALGNIVTAEMRHRTEVDEEIRARRLAEEAEDGPLDTTESAAASDTDPTIDAAQSAEDDSAAAQPTLSAVDESDDKPISEQESVHDA